MATGYDFQSISGSSKKRTRNQTAKGREFQRHCMKIKGLPPSVAGVDR